MPRRIPTIHSMVTNTTDPEIAISDDQWERFNTVLGKPLPQSLKAELQEATKRYLHLGVFSVQAVPVALARNNVNTLNSMATDFLEAILENESHVFENVPQVERTESEEKAINVAKSYATGVIKRHLGTVGTDQIKMRIIEFIDACKAADDEIAKVVIGNCSLQTIGIIG